MMKLSFLKPHSPCDPPEPYFSMYAPEDLPPPVRDEREITHFNRHLKDSYAIWRQLDPERALKHRAQYMGCVTMVDDVIGQVLDKLEAMQVLDNTLIVLTSDHGDLLCDHHFQQKGLFFEPSVKVPLIFSGPGIPAGRHVAENVSHIDLMPTLLDYCNLYMPRRRDPQGRLIYADQTETDAMSLMPYFQSDAPVCPDRIIVAENAMRGRRIMLKQGNRKINYYFNPDADDEIEAYDLETNPNEMNYLCDPCSLVSLSPELQQAFSRVRAKGDRHADRYYYFQNKIRPVYT